MRRNIMAIAGTSRTIEAIIRITAVTRRVVHRATVTKTSELWDSVQING
jgi:hypothetical protein